MTEAQTTQCEHGRKGGGDLMLLALVAVVSCVAGMVILGFLSNCAESAVANVLLSTEGCRVAQQLEIKTTPAGSECRLVPTPAIAPRLFATPENTRVTLQALFAVVATAAFIGLMVVLNHVGH